MTFADEPLWPITLVRLTNVEDATPWLTAFTRFAPFALPWIHDENEAPLTPEQWIENVWSWIPNVWLGVDGVDSSTATVWLVGGLDDVLPYESASIHGMAHPLLNTRASKKHTAKGWMAKALFSAAFDEYACHTLMATISTAHIGARGFCLNYGFRPHNHTASQQEKTYSLTASRYYAHHR